MPDMFKGQGVSDGPAAADFDTDMPDGLVIGIGHAFEVALVCLVKPVHHILIELALISLERQHIVCLLVDNALRNVGLADGYIRPAHRIYRHDASRYVQQLEQFRNRRNFIGFIIDFTLTQQQPILTSPGTDQMNRVLADGAIPTAPRGLTINGNHLAARHHKHLRYPARKPRLERRRIQQAEHSPKRIVGQDTMLELQKLP